MRNIGIIPARSGSKGLPDKNIKNLCGKPLIAYSIEAAIQSKIFDTIMVSTDSKKYADIARTYGADVPFFRSKETSSDSASSWDMIDEVLQRYEEQGKNFDTFSLLQPTSPLRTADDIINAYEVFANNKASVVVSMVEVGHPLSWCGKVKDGGSIENFVPRDSMGQRQIQEKYYRPNGAIYIQNIKDFGREHFLYRRGSYAYVMPKERSVDIDTDIDFRYAEFLMEQKINKREGKK